jgi:hypothetical protein
MNEAISLLTTQVLFCYHQYFDVRPQLSWLLDPVLRRFDSTRFRVSPKARSKLIQENSLDVKWMEERLGDSLDEDLGGESPYDLVDGAQLLSPSQVGVSALRALFGHRVESEAQGELPREVAYMAHELIDLLTQSRRLPLDAWANDLRDTALKIESEVPLGLPDALTLMRIAAEIRPKGPLISRKVVEWQEKLQDISGHTLNSISK